MVIVASTRVTQHQQRHHNTHAVGSALTSPRVHLVEKHNCRRRGVKGSHMAVQDDTGNSEIMPHSKTLTIASRSDRVTPSPRTTSHAVDSVIETEKSTFRLRLHTKRHGHAPRVCRVVMFWFTGFFAWEFPHPLNTSKCFFFEQHETNSSR